MSLLAMACLVITKVFTFVNVLKMGFEWWRTSDEDLNLAIDRHSLHPSLLHTAIHPLFLFPSLTFSLSNTSVPPDFSSLPPFHAY